MKSWIQTSAAAALLLLSTGLISPAMADSTLPMNSELNGIENILSVIGNVSLSQSDLRSNQTLIDVMDAKSDMYSNDKQTLARPVPASQLASKKAPTSRHTKSY
jgi:hypothetical protein